MGFSLQSDLAPVMAQYEADKSALQLRAETYKGEQESPRWAELRIEIERKKSALQVEGRTAVNRAEEFGRLNYLLEYRQAGVVQTQTTEVISDTLELEALALELELELFSI